MLIISKLQMRLDLSKNSKESISLETLSKRLNFAN